MLYYFDWIVFVCSLYGLCLLLWQWRKVHHATEVYAYMTVLFFGLTLGSGLHTFVASGRLAPVFGLVTPIIILCAIAPMCYSWTRRAWLFAHSSEEELQKHLSVTVCPILGKYCGPLGAHKKQKEERK